MKIKFELTEQYISDTTLHLLKVSTKFKSQFRSEMILFSIMSLLISFFIYDGTIVKKIAFSIFLTSILTIIIWFVSKKEILKRAKRGFQELYNSNIDKIFTVEISENGLVLSMPTIQTLYKWDSIIEIDDTDNSISIFMNNSVVVILRRDVFSSTVEEQQFIELLVKYSGIELTSRTPTSPYQ